MGIINRVRVGQSVSLLPFNLPDCLERTVVQEDMWRCLWRFLAVLRQHVRVEAHQLQRKNKKNESANQEKQSIYQAFFCIWPPTLNLNRNLSLPFPIVGDYCHHCERENQEHLTGRQVISRKRKKERKKERANISRFFSSFSVLNLPFRSSCSWKQSYSFGDSFSYSFSFCAAFCSFACLPSFLPNRNDLPKETLEESRAAAATIMAIIMAE